jgi:hypothetical protein
VDSMYRAPPLIDQARLLAGLGRGLGPFFRDVLPAEAAKARLARTLAAREANFAHMIEHGIFRVEHSPYRRLFEHAGAELGDVLDLMRREGVEGALARLADAGVYVRLDEFKGRTPIRRGSLEFGVASRDFDNPLSGRHVEVQSGGSRSAGTRVYVDLGLYAHDAAYDAVQWAADGLHGRTFALWSPAPPSSAAIGTALCRTLMGVPIARWFAQSVPAITDRTWRHAVLLAVVRCASKREGRAIPRPELVKATEARRVAAWLAERKEAGEGCVVYTSPSASVRVALAAREAGLDIAGTVFEVVGEPMTDARARALAHAGCRASICYGMGEVRRVGQPCGAPAALDDVHVLIDKLALIRRERLLPGGASVMLNVYTTLLPVTPKLMLNLESDDYGVVEERACGCALGELGFDLHLHTIRSHEKLTSEAMNFLGHDLIRVVEEVLPGSFGGGPTDYQLVEEETPEGLPRVRLVVSPRVGDLNEHDVVARVIRFLNDLPGAGGACGERWRDGQTLSIVRREPYTTSASKVLALHTMKRKKEPRVRGVV